MIHESSVLQINQDLLHNNSASCKVNNPVAFLVFTRAGNYRKRYGTVRYGIGSEYSYWRYTENRNY